MGEYTDTGRVVNADLISTGLANPVGIAVSGSDLYISSGTPGVVGEYTTSGGTVNASLITGLNSPAGLAISGGDLFVANGGVAGVANSGSIGEYTLAGTAVNASLVTGLEYPLGLAASGSNLYVSIPNSGSIGEYSTSGATENASLVTGISLPTFDAVSGSDIFVVDSLNNVVGEYSTSGTTVNTSLFSQFGLGGIAVVSTPTWTGSTDATWAGANWGAYGVPGSGAAATFNASSASVNGHTTIDLGSGVTIQSILFDTANAAAYTIGKGAVGSQTLTLNDGGSIVMNSTVANNQTFNAALTLGTDATAQTYTFTNNSTTNSLNFAGNLSGGSGGTAGVETLAVGGAGNTSISGQILAGGATKFNLTKSGAGAVTLSGNDTGLSGTTTIDGGTLALNFAASGALTTNIIAHTSGLNFGGGTLDVIGTSSSSTQTFASTALVSGQNVVSPSGSAMVALGAITENNGATIEFAGPATIGAGSTPVAATGTITTTTVGPGAGGNFGQFSQTGNGAYATVGLYDWASTDTTTGAVGTSPYTIVGGSGVSGFYQTTGVTTGGNYDVTAGAVNSIASNGSYASDVRFNSSASGALTITVAGGSLWENLYGVLVTPNVGSNNTNLTGGTIEISRSGSLGNSFLDLWQNNTAGYLNIASVLDGGRETGQNNGVVQAGHGTVVYSGTNTYELSTYLDGGYAVINSDASFGNVADAGTTPHDAPGVTSLYLQGGTAVGNATFTLDNNGANLRPVVLAGPGGGLAATTGNTFTVDGVVGGPATSPLTIGIAASSANNNTAGLLPGSGAGTANLTGVYATGTVALTGANTYSGGTVVASGTVQINGLNALGGTNYGGLTLNGGALQYAPGITGSNGSTDVSGGAGLTLASGGGTVDTNGNAVSYANSIGNGGSGALTIASTASGGSLTLLSSANYTGSTTVSSGTLKNGIANALPTTTDLSLASSGTYDLDGFNQTIDGISGTGTITDSSATASTLLLSSATTQSTFSGNVTGDVTIEVAGNATITLTGTNSSTGGTTVSSGTLSVSSASSLGSGTLTIASATFDYTGASGTLPSSGIVVATGNTAVLTNTGGSSVVLTLPSVNENGGTFELDGGKFVISGNITGQEGSDPLYTGGTTVGLTATSSYSGPTTISGGSTVLTGVSGALPGSSPYTDLTVTSSADTLDLLGTTQTVDSVTGSGQIISSNGNASTPAVGTSASGATASFTVNTTGYTGGTDTFAGSLGGSGGLNNLSLTKAGTGTLALTGTNTYTGGTTVSGGTLLANSTNSTGSGSVTVQSGATLGGNGTIATSGVATGTAITIASGATLSPAATTGGTGTSTLTLALHSGTTINLVSGAKLAFDLGASGLNDTIRITGGILNLNSQSFSDFDFALLTGFTGAGLYDLFATDNSSDITGSLGATTGAIGTSTGTLSIAGADVVLTVAPAAVPEPTTWALLLAPLAFLAFTQARRARR